MTNRRDFLKKTGLASGALAISGVFTELTASENRIKNNIIMEANNQITTAKAPSIKLNNGVNMPLLGVGSFALPTIQAADDISFALKNGYRLVDTASNYGNEKEVGEGIARSGINRSELFITTKLWIEDFGYDNALKAFDKSLKLLNVEYLDLYLLHWPVPTDFEKTMEAYKALEKLYEDKRIRAIGVSNFTQEHLTLLMDKTIIIPAVNQIELHPYHNQKLLREFHDKNGIKTQSWSPIGGIFTNGMANPTDPLRLLQDFTIVKLAEKYNKFTSQIVLRWQIQNGLIAIPKSQHYERLLGNINIFDFEISVEDMAAIDNLDRNLRGGPKPESFNVPLFKQLISKRSLKLQQ